MANPIVRQSVDGAADTTEGSAVDSLGHYHAGLFVAVDGDVTDLTVTLEASPDGERWGAIETLDGPTLEIGAADLTTDPSSGEETAARYKPGTYAYQLRARVAEYSGTGTVDAYVLVGGNAGQGNRPTARKGPASDL